MNRIRSVRRRVPRTRASLFSAATGTVAAAGLMLAALAPGALAADTPVAAPVPAPAAAAPVTPDGYPAVPDRLLTAPGSVASAAPANDNFSNAQIITGYSGATYGDNVGASAEEGEPGLPGIDDGGPSHSVWYSWTAPATGDVSFDLCANPRAERELASFDSTIGAYTGSSLLSLSNVSSNDDSCGSSSAIFFNAVSGTTYSITIDGYGGDFGYFYLQWYLQASAETISIDDVSAPEGTSIGQTTTFLFKVSLSTPASDFSSVSWETVEGTATAPGDFVATSGTVVFLEGDSTAQLAVDVVADSGFEPDESFTVLLSAPEGAEPGDASGTGTIENDDAGADLSVYIDKFGGKVRVGGSLPYYVQVFNAAGGDTANVIAFVDLPENAPLVHLDVSQGSCVQDGDSLSCAFGAIESGGYAYAIIYLVPNQTGVYEASVTLDTDVQDPFPKDNSDSDAATVYPDKAGCTMIGTLDDDEITGTADSDVICTYGGDDFVDAGDGNDIVRAGSGYDLVHGGPGFDQLEGAAGQDTLFGGASPDVINGGTGRDTVSYGDDPSSVTVDLGNGIGYDGYAGSPVQGANYDTLISVGDAIGSAHDDSLIGSAELDNIFGGGGDDVLSGLGSRDFLDGQAGTDSLDGGDSRDTCLNGEVLTSCER